MYHPLISTTLFLGLPVLVFNVFSPHYSSLCVNVGIRLQSRSRHPGRHSVLDPYVPNTFLFHSLYNPLVLHKRDKSSLDHSSCSNWSGLPSVLWIVQSPYRSTLVRLHHYEATCSLPNYFSLCPFHLVSYTHTTVQPFSFPSYPPCSLPLPATVPTFKQPNLTQ